MRKYHTLWIHDLNWIEYIVKEIKLTHISVFYFGSEMGVLFIKLKFCLIKSNHMFDFSDILWCYPIFLFERLRK